jgi:hypothetical protein
VWIPEVANQCCAVVVGHHATGSQHGIQEVR